MIIGLALGLLGYRAEEAKMEKMTRTDAREKAREMRAHGWNAKAQQIEGEPRYWVVAAKTLTMAKGADWLYLREGGQVR